MVAFPSFVSNFHGGPPAYNKFKPQMDRTALQIRKRIFLTRFTWDQRAARLDTQMPIFGDDVLIPETRWVFSKRTPGDELLIPGPIADSTLFEVIVCMLWLCR